MKSKEFNSMRRILLLVLVLVMAIAAVPGFADAFDNSTTLPDGDYTQNVTEVLGGSSKVSISCNSLIVKDGKATAELVFTSKSMTKMVVGTDETVYTPVIDEEKKTATVTLPVKVNGEFLITATTVAMSTPKDVEYNVTIKVDVPAEDKLTGNKYNFTSGANGSWTLGGEGTLDFVVDGPFDAFKGLTVNGKELAKENYTAISGSTNISLKDSYLNTLEVGSYELAASYESGSASTKFTVAEKTAEPEKVENKLNSGEEVKLAPGKYEAVDSEAITEGNKMFRSIQATLTVNEDGSAVLDMYLSGTGYDAIYNGEKLLNMPNGAISKDNEDNPWTGKDLPVSEAAAAEEGTVNGETKLHYQLKFDKLYSWILVGGHSGNYDQWSHKTLNFAADNFKLAEEKSSPKTADFGSQMTIWVVICIFSISALICELRRNNYE